MQYWPFWLGGVALASMALGNWLIQRRMLAVSGRFTALVDRLRFGPPRDEEMTEAELLAAVRAATADAFGDDALEPVDDGASEPPALPVARPRATHHMVFFASLIAGGALSAALAGTFSLTPTLRGDTFVAIFGGDPLVWPLVLGGGGVLVGFGTRMAAGCTSGHGLCGVSRGQPGSLVATASFFGMGIFVSLLLGALS